MTLWTGWAGAEIVAALGVGILDGRASGPNDLGALEVDGHCEATDVGFGYGSVDTEPRRLGLWRTVRPMET